MQRKPHGLLARLLNATAKLLTRIVMPGLAKDMAREGHFDFRDPVTGAFDRANFVEVEDNGADVTIISFAGMAVLWAGMPKFEFRKVLNETGIAANHIFVRDTQRACYFLGPDGAANGLDFYCNLLNDELRKLGSRYHIAVGASVGGAGAFYCSSILPVHQIVTFSPAFPQQVYLDPATRRRVFLDWRKLLRDPAAYFELVMVCLGASYVWRKVVRVLGEEHVPDVTAAYLGSQPVPPPAVIFYGRRALPDRVQAEMHDHIPTITTIGLDSGRHNCAGDLKKAGTLSETLRRALLDHGLGDYVAQRAPAASA